MSGAYGDSREKRFKAYYARIGKPSYAPDYLDNLLTVMADPGGCADHRVLAWVVYRAPGNQKEFAIYLGTGLHGRAEEILLTQADCALDLAWLEAGYPPEWLDAPRPVWHTEVSRRGVQPLDKSIISRAVAYNRNRGTMAPRDGQKLAPAVSTDPAKVALFRQPFRSHKQRSAEFSGFMERWKVAHSKESEELEGARSTVERIRKLALSDYRKEKRSAAPQRKRARSYNLLEPSINEGPRPPVERTNSVGLPPDANTEEQAHAVLQREVLPASRPEALTPAMPSVPPPDPPSYAILKRLYPQWRFDEPKSKPLFEALTTAGKALVIERLRVYLECERWTDDGGQYVPFCSNWLPTCEAEPPPALRLRCKTNQKLEDKAKSLGRSLAFAQALSRSPGGDA
jgi:hypothetical protein